MTASKTVATVEQTQSEMNDPDFANIGMSGSNPFASVSLVEFVNEIKSSQKLDVFKFVIYCNMNQKYSAQVIAAVCVYIDNNERKEIKMTHKSFCDRFDNVTQIKVSETKSRTIPDSTFMKIIGCSTIRTFKDKEKGTQIEYVADLKYLPVDETNEAIMKNINANIKAYKIEVERQTELNTINIDDL